jgi:hypothetical protein
MVKVIHLDNEVPSSIEDDGSVLREIGSSTTGLLEALIFIALEPHEVSVEYSSGVFMDLRTVLPVEVVLQISSHFFFRESPASIVIFKV